MLSKKKENGNIPSYKPNLGILYVNSIISVVLFKVIRDGHSSTHQKRQVFWCVAKTY